MSIGITKIVYADDFICCFEKNKEILYKAIGKVA